MNRSALLIAAAALLLVEFSRRAQASQAPADSVGRSDSLFSDFTDWASNMTSDLTRGERNNNPGNLRKGIAWVGLSADQPDSAFATFDSPEYGIRALAMNLRTYFHKYGLLTVRQIINRWAPSIENDTSAYIAAVANDMGIDADAPLNLDDPTTLQALTAAIIHHENGRVAYAPDLLSRGVSLAFA